MDRSFEKNDILTEKQLKPVKVLEGMKQTVLVLEGENGTGEKEYFLFRPERTLNITPDDRIPLPTELYRDLAVHHIDHLLGWDITPVTQPWSLISQNGQRVDKGVIRPYFEKINPLQIEMVKGEIEAHPDFWYRLAVLDYLCGVIDRSLNDILKPKGMNRTVVVDSGLSFVEGIDFFSQHSVARDHLRGKDIPEDIITELTAINKNEFLDAITSAIELTPAEIESFFARLDHLLRLKKIV